MKKNIGRNAFRCKKCGMVVESKSVHDFQECKCGNFTDGGLEYIRRGGNLDDMEDLSEPHIDFKKLKEKAEKKKKKLTKEEMLKTVEDGVDDLIAMAGENADKSSRVSKVYDKVSLVFAIIAAVALVLANVLGLMWIMAIGGMFFFASVILDVKSDTSFNNFLAMRAHEDQMRQMKALTIMARELDNANAEIDKLKKKKSAKKKAKNERNSI